MELEFLKSDNKRIEKKLEQLNKEYLDIEYPKKLDKIERRIKEIKKQAGNNLKAELWFEVYQDVFTLGKKSNEYKNLKKDNR